MRSVNGNIFTGQQDIIVDSCVINRDSVIAPARAGAAKSTTSGQVAKEFRGRVQYTVFGSGNKLSWEKSYGDYASVASNYGLAHRALGYIYRQQGRLAETDKHIITKIIEKIGKAKLKSQNIGGYDISTNMQAYDILRMITQYCYSIDNGLTINHGVSDFIYPDESENIKDKLEKAYYSYLLPRAKYIWGLMCDLKSDFPVTHDCYAKNWSLHTNIYNLEKGILKTPNIGCDLLISDETQDINPVFSNVFRKQDCQKLILGDSHQSIFCQPPDTMVKVVYQKPINRQKTIIIDKKISELQEGDRVVTNCDKNRQLRMKGKSVLSVTKTVHSGQLIKVTSNTGKISKYTPKHHCYVRLGEELKDNHAVYLMEKNGQFRIGVTPFVQVKQNNTFGIGTRAGKEKADSMWVLELHKSRAKALTREAYLQVKYGLPSITFIPSLDRNLDNCINVEKFWLLVGDNSKRALTCLKDYGKLLEFPLWRKGENYVRHPIGFRKHFVIAACNLCDGMKMLDYDIAYGKLQGRVVGRETSDHSWYDIKVNRIDYQGDVYSIEVEDDHNYFADGLLTHNCWRGAIDAMNEFDINKTLPLSKSFRFGTQIGDVAHDIINFQLGESIDIQGFDKIKSVVHTTPKRFSNRTILCRTNSECVRNLVDNYNLYKVKVVGDMSGMIRDIKGILALRSKSSNPNKVVYGRLSIFKNYKDLIDYVKTPAGGELKTLISVMQKAQKMGIDAIKLCDILKTSAQTRKPDIIISTAHKSKGAEFDNVELSNDFRRPTDEGWTPEDTNLLYVAATRAKKNLDISGCAAILECLDLPFDHILDKKK